MKREKFFDDMNIPIIPKWMYILLWFVKPQHTEYIENGIKTRTTYKIMFGTTFLLDIERIEL